MKSRLLFATVCISASALATERWSSPDKFYSITPPAGWTQREDKGGGHTSFAFISQDQKSEIRVSATYNLVRLPEELPDEVLGFSFPGERGITAIEKIRGTGWDGLLREYTDAGEKTRWFAIAARRGTTVVLLTMRAPAGEFDRFRPIFKSVYESLTLRE